jgi:hypothetical protein
VATQVPRSPSPHPTKSPKNDSIEKPEKSEKPDKVEKEKKKKETGSSRQKKFLRHFQQVAVNEKVLNRECHLALTFIRT